MISRRRFLSIAAAATVAGPSQAEPSQRRFVRWQGLALGAEATLTIYATAPQANAALRQVRTLLRRAEALFSLYDPASQISALNRDGYLSEPAPEFVEILRLCDTAHRATQGAFDPTVQPLWQTYAQPSASAADITRVRGRVDWQRVTVNPDRITLGPDQALTLNGIAQGYATDLVADALRFAGFDRVLVNIGEFSGVGGPWHLGISDPVHGHIATRALTDGAIATSSPGALPLGQAQSHILGPKGQAPLWSTACVRAGSAALADAASTAFCLMPVPMIRRALANLPGSPDATLVDSAGRVLTVS